MFIQIIRGRVNDTAAIRAATNRWQAELKSRVKGYLGATSGVADDGTFIAVVRFESEEAARTNSEHHEQRAWWGKMSKLFYSTPQFYDCPTVDVYMGGGTDDAGFVQLEIFTGAKDIDALRAVDKEFEKLRHLRPDLIGVTTAVADDGTVFATNYFTSEAEAREGERKEISTEILTLIRRVAELTEDIEYIDLRDPWLHSNAEGEAMTTERFETVIIGGGQAGLSAGYHLAKRGRTFVILDANERIGDSWRKRWDSLRLFTPARYSGLPGWPFPGPRGSYPTKDGVADYLEAYAARFDLPVRAGVKVDWLGRDGGKFVVTSGDRRFEADNVVVASGPYQSPRVPAFAAELDPGIIQLDSTDYRDPSQLREGGVLVVGAGNSGAEIAFEVSRTHPTWLSGRDTGHLPVRTGSVLDRLLTPLFWFVTSHVLTTRTPIGRMVRPKLLTMGTPLERVRPKELAAAGIERVPRTAGVRDGFPALEDGRLMDVSNVIWYTGFRTDFGWIDLPVLGEDGEPMHERGVVEGEPGLYFVGRFFLFAFTSSLIGGVGSNAAKLGTGP